MTGQHLSEENPLDTAKGFNEISTGATAGQHLSEENPLDTCGRKSRSRRPPAGQHLSEENPLDTGWLCSWLCSVMLRTASIRRKSPGHSQSFCSSTPTIEPRTASIRRKSPGHPKLPFDPYSEEYRTASIRRKSPGHSWQLIGQKKKRSTGQHLSEENPLDTTMRLSCSTVTASRTASIRRKSPGHRDRVNCNLSHKISGQHLSEENPLDTSFQSCARPGLFYPDSIYQKKIPWTPHFGHRCRNL